MYPGNIKEILICKGCSGSGIVQQSELEDYHKGEYRYWNTICTMCKGNGRLLKTTEVTIVPYDNPEVSLLLLKKQIKCPERGFFMVHRKSRHN